MKLNQVFFLAAAVLVCLGGIEIMNGAFAGYISGADFTLMTVIQYFGFGFACLIFSVGCFIAGVLVEKPAVPEPSRAV